MSSLQIAHSYWKPFAGNFSTQTVVAVPGHPKTIKIILNKTETDEQTASCSVLHSCPTYPPVLKWNHPGQTRLQTQTLEGGQYRVTSTLTFHLTRADHNKTLRCSVIYHGGQRQKVSKVLQVKCECLWLHSLQMHFHAFLFRYIFNRWSTCNAGKGKSDWSQASTNMSLAKWKHANCTGHGYTKDLNTTQS